MCMMVAKDVSGAVGGTSTDAGNPLMGGGTGAAMTVYQQPSGYPARLPNGQVINFATEADYLKADSFVKSMIQQPAALGAPTIGGGAAASLGSGRGLLNTAADGAETVAAFLEGRNLRRRRDDLLDALDQHRAAKAELDAMVSKYPDLIPVLSRLFNAERDTTDAAIQTIEDMITAIDIQTGAGVARVAGDLLSDSPTINVGGNALAIGAAGLGLGVLLSGDRGRGRRRR
jgi:hypothetical protein